MNFAERVREFAEEDELFSSTEKVASSEGHRNVLRLLYQLCHGAAPKSQPAPRKACDFEGLYAPSDTALVAEGSPTLFHRVAELREEHQVRFRARRWPLPSRCTAGIEVVAPTLRLIPRLP